MSLHKKTTKSFWHDVREHHKIAFDDMCIFIRENAIEKGRCYFLTYLHRYYVQLLEEGDEKNSVGKTVHFTPHFLKTKIIKVFDKEIMFFSLQNKKLLAPKHLISIDEQSVEHLKDEDILLKAALLLRKSVLKTEKNKLPKKISAKNLKHQCQKIY